MITRSIRAGFAVCRAVAISLLAAQQLTNGSLNYGIGLSDGLIRKSRSGPYSEGNLMDVA